MTQTVVFTPNKPRLHLASTRKFFADILLSYFRLVSIGSNSDSTATKITYVSLGAFPIMLTAPASISFVTDSALFLQMETLSIISLEGSARSILII